MARFSITAIDPRLAAALLVAAGCSGGPTTYPVTGRIVYERGDVRLLAGSSVICQNQEQPLIEGRGDIKEDGTFELQTVWKGRILPGLVPGPYRAWISLTSEDGGEERQFHKTQIDPRYLSSNSDFVFHVPAADEVILTVTRAPPGAQRISAEEEPPALGVKCGDTSDEPGTPDRDPSLPPEP